MSKRRIKSMEPGDSLRASSDAAAGTKVAADEKAMESPEPVPWLALDENLLVRRVSPRFQQLAGGEVAEYIGQSLFRLLGQFGVAAADLDRVRSWATLRRSCFVELRPGRIGERTDHFALEIRPTESAPGWAIRYVAVGWLLAGVIPLSQDAGPKRQRQRRSAIRHRFEECRRAGRLVRAVPGPIGASARPQPLYP